jgi:hypothetical protein
VTGQCLAEPLQVGSAEGDRPTTDDAVRRVGEANEPIALLVLEQLHEGGKALVAGPLLHLDLVDERRPAPDCRDV